MCKVQAILVQLLLREYFCNKFPTPGKVSNCQTLEKKISGIASAAGRTKDLREARNTFKFKNSNSKEVNK